MQDTQETFTFISETSSLAPDQASGHMAHPHLRVRDVMSDQYVTIASNDTLLFAITTMSENHAMCAVVVDDKTLLGTLTQEDILQDVSKGADFQHLTVDQRLQKQPQAVTPEVSILSVAKLMETKGLCCLPVLDNGRLVGIVAQKHITYGLLRLHPLKCVADILTDPVITVDTGATVAETSDIMIAKKTPCVIALHQNVPAGIVTSKDLFRRVAAVRRDPMTTQVVEIMSFPLISIPPSYSILSTARKMNTLNLHSLVVMSQDHLHGIVTQLDVLQALRIEIDWIGQTNHTLKSETNSWVRYVIRS